MIRAEIHDDNYLASARFDATEWFEQANDEALKALIACQYRGDYAADNVADFFEHQDIGEPKTIDNVFQLCEAADIGYEVSIEPEDAIKWIQEHRPHLLSS